MSGPLTGLRVLDLSRILAGPSCTQLLADMGADVIKIENPKTQGDDTRKWGPPFVDLINGGDDLSTYFISVNRGKRSLPIDITTSEGQGVIRQLVTDSDILVENFKAGGLATYGLDYDSLSAVNRALIYCSITGFGQTGPNAKKPGYDLMAQAYGGLMSLTGTPDGQPMKAGVAVADVVCGLYAASGILAALHHRGKTGEGQHIDLALVDSQIAWLINQGSAHLATGQLPRRLGNAHPSIVPYQVFETCDGHVVIAVGNDQQFARFASWLGHADWVNDPRFATNPARLDNRDQLIPLISAAIYPFPTRRVVAGLEDVGVPVGPVQDLAQVFDSDQVKARDMHIKIPSPHASSGQLSMIGNPLKFSKTPVSYDRPPPLFGEHEEEILAKLKKED